MVRGVEQHSVPACRLKTAKLREHILQISAFAINPALAPQPHKSHQPGGGGGGQLLAYSLICYCKQMVLPIQSLIPAV